MNFDQLESRSGYDISKDAQPVDVSCADARWMHPSHDQNRAMMALAAQ